MAKRLPPHVEGLRAFLSQQSERNEDLALTYFRHVYGDSFKRQSDEGVHRADGYLPGPIWDRINQKRDKAAALEALVNLRKAEDKALEAILRFCADARTFERLSPADQLQALKDLKR